MPPMWREGQMPATGNSSWQTSSAGKRQE